MATTIPANPTVATISALLQKVNDADPDFRFMALSDLSTVLNIGKADLLQHDYNTASRTADHVVKALDDQNGEVQNQAIKCLGPLVKKVNYTVIGPMLEKISTLKLQNSVDVAVPFVALRAVVENLPRATAGILHQRDVQESYQAISRVLVPRFVGRGASRGGKLDSGFLDGDELIPEAVDLLIEIVRCFGILLQPIEVEMLQHSVVSILDEDKGSSVVKKRAVVAISMLAHYLFEEQLVAFQARASTVLGAPKIAPVTRRLYITILGSMARSIPLRIGPHLASLVPFVFKALDEDELQEQLEEINEGGGDSGLEFNEVREAALVTLEAFLAACPTEMKPFTNDSIDASLRYLKFDPNYAMDEDEEMEEDEEDEEDAFEDDDEFEADAGFDDDDDASWKVRRCAAKALYTIISTRSSGDLLDSGVLYRDVAPALVKRFEEREENVRLEVLGSLSLLVRKTGEGIIPEFSVDNSQNEYINQMPQSRKRRRQSSGGGASNFGLTMTSADLSGTGLTSPTLEKVPVTGPRADLAQLTSSIVKAVAKLLKGKLIPTKQASINLLDDIVVVQRGGLNAYFDAISGPIIDAVKSSGATSTSTSLSVGGGTASATASTLKIAALRLTGDIAKHHSSSILQPYIPKFVAAVVSAVHDRFYKISGEAVQTAEEVIKTITPPRSRLTAQKFKSDLFTLYDVIVDRTTANDADAEVRQKAIHALGTLLARTSGPDGAGLLPEDKRAAALGHLLDRLKNETTRLAAVRAVDTVAALSSDGVPFQPQWIQQVAVELAAQLRKANRALRGSSIMALKHLILSPATKDTLNDATVQSLAASIISIIPANDTQLLTPGLLVLAHLTQEKPKATVSRELTASVCGLVPNLVAGTVLDSLLVLVTSIGQNGYGKPLMQSLLKEVGIGGDPAVVGKVIGTLLVASGDSAGVTMDSFVGETKANSGDQVRTSLALTVLGEAGLRLGPKFRLGPNIFLGQFRAGFDKVSLAAAVALGRAGAGNIPEYLPVILKALQTTGQSQYLLLQSIKEILQQAALSSADISQHTTAIWDQLLASAGAEDNKAVCAECIGRMVVIDPSTYLPKLNALLKDESATLRAIAVQALRYTLPDENEAFDAMLKTFLIDMLKTMLSDTDLEIRRHALSTLNSATHNKPEIILDHFNELMPFVMEESVVKKELIREVMMGPFQHLIDDGLEVRKAAYETLYALMETAYSRISIIDLYDRIVAGLQDDNDIRALCNLMVSKLVFIAPEETSRRLDTMADAFRATLSIKLKDSAVKQELEKHNEAIKSVLRVTLLLGDKFKGATGGANAAGAPPPATATAASGSSQKWLNYWEWVNKDFSSQLKALRDESKEGN